MKGDEKMIYENIKRICDSKKISIRKLEQTLGFANGTIAKWQQSSPTVENLQKVAIFFNLKLEYFLNRIKDK